MADLSPEQLQVLLARHVPRLKYDSLEPYFCDSAAEWTDNPGNELHRADGSLIAAATPGPGEAQLALGYLGPGTYGDGSAVAASDRIADPAHDYVSQARAMHVKPGYADRTYGHAAVDSDGRTWLAYWFFYFYNDYNLVGSLLPAGLHEGDWEMIQLRLDPAGAAPDLAVYAQHRHAAARDWDQVEREGDQPVVYPARGSHASYFDADIHWTGAWFDNANGRRPAPPLTLEILHDGAVEAAWALWPGFWGATMPKAGVGEDLGFDDSSPRGPGGHAQWSDPVKLLDTVKSAPEPAAVPARPAPPGVSVTRAGPNLRLSYSTSDLDARALIVGISSDTAPQPVTYHVTIAAAQGTVEIAADLANSQSYVISTAVVTAAGTSSEAVDTPLDAAI